MTLRELARFVRRLGRLYRWPVLRPLFLAYWRARERDVGQETTGPGTKAAPDYPYGKVTGLYPDLLVMTETSESPYVCCGYCSAGMVVRAVRPQLANKMASVAHPIRADGGRPHNNGSRASELRAGAREAFDVELDALARGEIPDRLRKGFAVVVNVDYADLPEWLRVQGGSFGHSLALFGWRDDGDRAGVLDPLWANGTRGAWCPWEQLKPALWADGEHSGTVVRLEEPEPDEPDEPEPKPKPQPAYDPGPAIRDAEARGATRAYDAGVGAWLDWYRAPRPRPADVWDVGTWDHPALEVLEDVDPCSDGAPASWARGRVPAPARNALDAMAGPASWTGSTWAGALWG